MIRQFHIWTPLIYRNKQHQEASSHSDVQDQSFLYNANVAVLQKGGREEGKQVENDSLATILGTRKITFCINIINITSK